jgi:hypothetical protein
VRDSRGSIGDGEIGAGVRGPASNPLISRWVRSYAPRREGSRRHGSCLTRPRGCPGSSPFGLDTGYPGSPAGFRYGTRRASVPTSSLDAPLIWPSCRTSGLAIPARCLPQREHGRHPCARRSDRPTHLSGIFAARCTHVRASPSTRERLSKYHRYNRRRKKGPGFIGKARLSGAAREADGGFPATHLPDKRKYAVRRRDVIADGGGVRQPGSREGPDP